MQGSAPDALRHRGPVPASWLDSASRRPLSRPAGRCLERAVQAPRESLLSRYLLPQGNSVDDRRKRLLTEREIQMLFRHRQRELRSPLQPLREI